MLEHEEDIRQEFFTEYLRRNIKYDPARASLGSFIYMLSDATIRSYMYKLKQWNKRKEADVVDSAVGFFDSHVEMESNVEIEVFKQLVSKLKRPTNSHHSKCRSRNIYLDAFVMKCLGYFNRDIAKKMKVSDMYMSCVVRVLQALYRKYSGEVSDMTGQAEEQFRHAIGMIGETRYARG